MGRYRVEGLGLWGFLCGILYGTCRETPKREVRKLTDAPGQNYIVLGSILGTQFMEAPTSNWWLPFVEPTRAGTL